MRYLQIFGDAWNPIGRWDFWCWRYPQLVTYSFIFMDLRYLSFCWSNSNSFFMTVGCIPIVGEFHIFVGEKPLFFLPTPGAHDEPRRVLCCQPCHQLCQRAWRFGWTVAIETRWTYGCSQQSLTNNWNSNNCDSTNKCLTEAIDWRHFVFSSLVGLEIRWLLSSLVYGMWMFIGCLWWRMWRLLMIIVPLKPALKNTWFCQPLLTNPEAFQIPGVQALKCWRAGLAVPHFWDLQKDV